jgi:fibronectin type 3 domain-containing protein
MKAVLSGAYGASLGPWDIDAVRTVYTETVSVSLPAPANVVATATAVNRVVITWAAVSGATQYAILRSPSISSAFVQIGVSSTTSYTDSTVAPNTTYLYKVRAISSSATSADSVFDHATTIIFTDDPLTTSTPVKAVHLAEIRTAINAVRAAAALGPASWTDAAVPGVRVKAVHITEMRAALSPALTALGKTAVYSDPGLASGSPIRAVHFQELRNLVK